MCATGRDADVPPPVEVRVAACPADDAHEVLLAVVQGLLGTAGGSELRLTHACPGCASSDHGRPVVVGAPGVQVSLSRDRDRAMAVVAASRGARIGIDVERDGAVDSPAVAGIAAHPSEIVQDARARTRLWVGKEAVLKCRGTGLAVDPSSLVLDEVPEQLVDVDLGPGWCCRLAVDAPGAVQIVGLSSPS